MRGDTTVRARLGQEIKDSRALRARSLPLAVLASVVCTVFGSAFGTGRNGALMSAAVGPLITALFTTRGRMRARGVGIALVTLVAFAVTVTGFTVPEQIRGGKSLVANRSGTFVPTEENSRPDPAPSTPAPPYSPGIATGTTSLSCEAAVGGAGDCPPLEVRSAGTAPLQVTGVALEGPSAGEFTVTAPCTGTLTPGARCQITLEFHPAGAGPREAVLAIHQNLPGPATRITLHGTGTTGVTPVPVPSGPVASDPVPASPDPSNPVPSGSP
jgi:hypothetical protein